MEPPLPLDLVNKIFFFLIWRGGGYFFQKKSSANFFLRVLRRGHKILLVEPFDFLGKCKMEKMAT